MTDLEIAGFAVRSLLLEASLAPKPGLVTPYNNGSHKDMNFQAFVKSALALIHCFETCAAVGRDFAGLPPEDALPSLRKAGLQGEKAMYRVTEGVNTHKGAIYLLGFLCAAVGRALGQSDALSGGVPPPRDLARSAGSFVRGTVQRELVSLARKAPTAFTAGERAYRDCGFTGARGEVEGGYPLTLEALSYLDTQLSFTQLQLPSCRLKDALVDTFFFIVARNSDTNLYARGGLEGVETAKTLAQEVLRSGGVSTPQGREKIRSAEKIFVQKNLSPGGSADILSSTVFLLQIMELAIYAQDAVSLAGNEE